jgi:hypothetical protein
MEVEIQNYYKTNADGNCQGNFTLVIEPNTFALKVLKCRHFKKSDSEWFGFPVEKSNNRMGESQYIPYVAFSDREFKEEVNEMVIKAIHNLPESEIRISKSQQSSQKYF